MRKLLAVLLLAAAPSLAGAQLEIALGTVKGGSTPPAPAAAAHLPPPPDTGPRTAALYRGFELRGTTTFIAVTEEALDLLAGSTTFTEVAPYIGVIEQSTRSGMVAWTERPVFQVGAASWRHSAHWYAGIIAHDGMHSLLYRAAKPGPGLEPPDGAWTGVEAERTCLAYQARVLQEINAGEYYSDYVLSLIDDPDYHLIPYEDRDW